MSPYQEALPPPATCKRDLARTRGLFRWESVEGLLIEITLECTAGPCSESKVPTGGRGGKTRRRGGRPWRQRSHRGSRRTWGLPTAAGSCTRRGRAALGPPRPPSTFHFQISSLQKAEDSVPHISSHRIVVTCLRLPRGTVTPAEAWSLAVSLLTVLIKEK